MAKQRVKHFEDGGAVDDILVGPPNPADDVVGPPNPDDTAIGPGDPGWGGDIGTDTDPRISDPSRPRKTQVYGSG